MQFLGTHQRLSVLIISTHNKAKHFSVLVSIRTLATPTMSDEIEKAPGFESAFFKLKVKNLEDGKILFFKVNRNMKLRRLMNEYCHRLAMRPDSYVFLFEGNRLNGRETPNQLEMKSEDEIEAVLHQQGGSQIAIK